MSLASGMPVIPEDIWMHILQISDEDAFLLERAQITKGYHHVWSRNHPTSSAVTLLKPISAKFSAVCTQWRKVVHATSECWVTTVNGPSHSPLLATALQPSLQFRQASDIDTYIQQGYVEPEKRSLASFELCRLTKILLEHLCRWRSLMLIDWEDPITHLIIDGLNRMEAANRLISFDVIGDAGRIPKVRKLSSINSQFPGLRRLHIDTNCGCVAIGDLASLPNVTHLSVSTSGVNIRTLFARVISQIDHLESLIIRAYDKRIDLEAEPPVIRYELVPDIIKVEFAFPFLTTLEIELRICNVLSFLCCIELPALRTLHIDTGHLDRDDPPYLFPGAEIGKRIDLPSLLSFKIIGLATPEKHFTLICHFRMPCLLQLSILSGNFNRDLGRMNLPQLHLPSLKTMSLRPPPAASDFGRLFITPNLEMPDLFAWRVPLSDMKYEYIYRPKHVSFPKLRNLEMNNYTPMGIDAFLSYHDLPALVSIRLVALAALGPLPVWGKFFERQGLTLAKLEKFDVKSRYAIPEDLQELLSECAPYLSSCKSSGHWRAEKYS